MRFKFIGDPLSEEDTFDTGFMGISFPKDTPVDVEDEAIIDRLKVNSHFSAVTGPGRKKVEKDGNED